MERLGAYGAMQRASAPHQDEAAVMRAATAAAAAEIKAIELGGCRNQTPLAQRWPAHAIEGATPGGSCSHRGRWKASQRLKALIEAFGDVSGVS